MSRRLPISPWSPVETCRPPEGEVVNAMDSGGHVQKLKRKGNLWWFPDGSMYVYFTPVMWQPLSDDISQP